MSADRSNPGGRVAEHQRSGRGTKRVGYPIGIRRLAVRARTQLTPSMLRLTLGGEELAGFHSYQCDDHVRLVFPDPDGTRRDPVANEHDELDWPHPFPTSRKYTVRRVDLDALELDIDVVLHPGGVASEWAAGVSVGEEVSVAGPPGAVAFGLHYEHFVLAVDATALPAAARWLEESPADVSGHLLVDVDDDHECAYPLEERPGVEVRWLSRRGGSTLAEAVTALELPANSFLFAAGEADDIKPLRSWARGRLDHVVTGYWRRGVADLDD